jgi:23S rRNA pseudouridine2604 synthase
MPEGDGLVRISKLLAERGICSRREAERYIEQGLVLIDGKPVTELGAKAHPSQTVGLAAKARAQQSARQTLLLNKPVGYVSHADDDHRYPAAADLIRPSLRGLAPAGRLDIDSTGLLVLTQDGVIARQLIGQDRLIEKEYLVRVEGELSAKGLSLLNHGLVLDDRPLRPAKVRWMNKDQLQFVLAEGRKRQIRRMCEMVGLKVTGLKRVRIGRIMLGDLPEGQWRALLPNEKF